MRDKWIVQTLKMAFLYQDYSFAIRLISEYSLTVHLNQTEIVGSMIKGLNASPSFTETKLVLIGELLPVISYESAAMLLEAMEQLLVSTRESHHNFLNCSNNALLVIFQMYRMAQKIYARFNRLDARLQKF